MRYHPICDHLAHVIPSDTDKFEGWYFRLTDKDGRNPIAIIPGISTSKNEPHAFIIILDGTDKRSYRFKYPISSYSFVDSPFSVSVDQSHFSLSNITMNTQGDFPMEGTLYFTGGRPWRGSFFNPKAMGFIGFIPFLQCYHGVLRMSCKIQGVLTFNGTTIDYSGGCCYMEKDWGPSFPSSWIWSQSSHFPDRTSSAMISVATIPLAGTSFTGFIFGLDSHERFYRMATYTGARILRLKTWSGGAEIVLEDRFLQAELGLGQGRDRVDPLPFPADKGLMSGLIEESLDAELSIRITRKLDNQTLFEGTGTRAGLELGPGCATLGHMKL